MIIFFGMLFVYNTKNTKNEVLIVSAYLISIEVLMRMTGDMFFNEFAKYGVILFMIMGMFFSGFSKNSLPYWFFLLLLIPGVILSTVTLSLEADIRKAIAFNIAGPVCLGIASIYCYRRRITFAEINAIIIAFAMPLVSLLTYLFMYNPSVRDVVTGTSSNFATSGGFGPNQVSTILGLGMFVFFALFLLNSKSKFLFGVHALLTMAATYRGLVTFSRGGVYTGILMIIVFLIVVYLTSNKNTKARVGGIAGITVLFAVLVWGYSSYQTNGLIEKRYANQDAIGRVKEDKLGGRERIAISEIQMFLDNPLLGIGVGKNKEYREETTGIVAASHNEITRMLAEHGSLGIAALLILLATPLILYLDNKANIYVLPFFIFWLLTINHAAMRTAAPAFVYALSLLKVYTNEKPSLHRE
ncbi:O-antigen ligase family protein [Flavobacterium qiangtangense]|uniref:O-antigen ligase family protein n=1 Tax=Flavobacterium qiangtangense TaxID=1442595 RepID=A0ABW1PQU5_9FLAO